MSAHLIAICNMKCLWCWNERFSCLLSRKYRSCVRNSCCLEISVARTRDRTSSVNSRNCESVRYFGMPASTKQDIAERQWWFSSTDTLSYRRARWLPVDTRNFSFTPEKKINIEVKLIAHLEIMRKRLKSKNTQLVWILPCTRPQVLYSKDFEEEHYNINNIFSSLVVW